MTQGIDTPHASRPATPFPSDQRLLTEARYQGLRDHLALHDLVEPRTLARLLGHPLTEEEVGLVQFLTLTQLISPEEMKNAKERKRTRSDLSLADALAESGALGEVALAMGLAAVSRLSFFAFKPETADSTATRRLDAHTALSWRAFPARFQGGVLLLATTDPRRIDLEEATAFMDHPVRVAVAPASTILQAIDLWYGGQKGRQENTLSEELDLRGALDKGEPAISGSDATTLINRILLAAARMKASDIHLVPDSRAMRVDFRLDGAIQFQTKIPLNLAGHVVSRIKVLAGLDISERRLPQDGAIRARLADRELDLRVSVLPAVRGEAVVLRLLDMQVGIVKLEELGFNTEDRERLRRALRLPHGLILLTGPTGSGKSTTLRAALDYILSQGNRHILTVEDPVEVKMDGITQVRVHEKIDFTFARALRHFLRHDPDVIMVGEIRDGETARIAVQAALTGHLVLTTLHTNDAPGAVARLLDMGVEPYLLSSAVTLVIAQRLARLLCVRCRRPAPITPDEQQILLSMGWNGPSPATLWHPAGCEDCNRTGFKGRTVLHEFLPIDDELRGMIARRESAAMLRAAARTQGFLPLIASGIGKVLAGVIPLNEATAHLDVLN
ncbi:MAG: Flp pilus assembly complex ATPase component TadA [Magnetococcales bacterium]|nr:Flp pilus assembly complex ATPase component TadA [Magnetococcales bacterium]